MPDDGGAAERSPVEGRWTRIAGITGVLALVATVVFGILQSCGPKTGESTGAGGADPPPTSVSPLPTMIVTQTVPAPSLPLQVRRKSPVNLGVSEYLDLDSSADNWAGSNQDVSLYPRRTYKGLVTSLYFVSAVMVGSAATPEFCSVVRGYTSGWVDVADLGRGYTYCARSDQNRIAILTVDTITATAVRFDVVVYEPA